MKSRTGEKTLLASVMMSSPGPLVLGIALFFGRSSTQMADFVRRTIELVAIIVSYVVFRITRNEEGITAKRKNHLERIANLTVGFTLLLSGATILYITLTSNNSEKGNVIPGLVISLLGVVVNSWFYIRYKVLNKEENNKIYQAQGKLYGAKALVDTCVAIALASILIAPNAPVTSYIDLIGSVVVALYMIFSGAVTLLKRDEKVALLDK